VGRAVGLDDLEEDVLQGVVALPGSVLTRIALVGQLDQGIDARHVRGLTHLRLRNVREVERFGGSDAHGLDIGGVPTRRAHEGVLTVLGDCQELLRA
jgi:hypothetical protein